MKLTKKEKSLDLGINMTPMIDIVFQLIIFFMVVSELATIDLERMNLPFAIETDISHDVIDKATMLTINVTRETENRKSEIKHKRVAYTDLELDDLMRFEARVAGQVPNPADPTKKISELQVLIRADRDALYEGVQRVFAACGKHGVWKTSVASTQEKYVREKDG